MDAKTIATVIAAGRVAVGVGLVAAPEPIAKGWVGDDGTRPGAKLFAGGLGVRDLAIGLGTLNALRSGEAAKPWLIASALADLGDLAGTLRQAGGLSTNTVLGTVVVAGGAAAAGFWLAAQDL